MHLILERCNVVSESNANAMETTSIKGANFNVEGDVIGYFLVAITYKPSYSLALNKKFIEIHDYNIIDGKATEEEIIDATEAEFGNASVSIED